MITIVYVSRARRPMMPFDLTDLLRGARDRNTASDVTGMLLYAQESFMQQLEGPDDAVGAIFDSITADERHTELRLLARRPVQARRFDGWSMGFDHPDPNSLAKEIAGYRTPTRAPLVDPALVTSAEMAEALLGVYAEALAG